MATAYLRKVSWASCMKFHPEESVRHLHFCPCAHLRTCLLSNFSLRPQTLIHLIDRKTKKEVGTKFYTGAMCVYHQVNAFEDDGHVVCDVIAYDDNSLYDMFYLDKLKEQLASATNPLYCKPRCKRFVLPLSDKVQLRVNNILKGWTSLGLKEYVFCVTHRVRRVRIWSNLNIRRRPL